MEQKRYLQPYILEDLRKKMVFLGGPRQVGKTTLAEIIGRGHYAHPLYLNWDDPDDRKTIHQRQFETDADLIIFDEIHKYALWKNYLKGLYDKQKDKVDILITGSARLDIYRRGGDSLQGRYHHYRLHPFSLAEIFGNVFKIKPFQKIHFSSITPAHQERMDELTRFGGFPEPFLAQDVRSARRWHTERLDRLVKEEIRDLEPVRHLSLIQILVGLLPERVGSPLSSNNLREDLQVSYNTVVHWLEVLERFYYCFRIRPFSGKLARTLRKEPKLYLWDWSEINDESIRFENLVASHLLKLAHFMTDVEGYRTELGFLKDVDGREVDFVMVVEGKPWFAVEVKQADTAPAKSLAYFGQRLKIPNLFQVVQKAGVDFLKDDVRVMSAAKFLSGLI